ncbi:hypothetical protein GQ55_5G306200 [Panicum hallii var. hallii]|uniref:Uncharacterized protein n=1 Tax=Panicum hallii var. hallii TaxID=1504633 RepID=A0A2T7DLL7_9POAL|nr:hypothetical protein GQ55_5G306200 [Panicum hallii var. hallii]
MPIFCRCISVTQYHYMFAVWICPPGDRSMILMWTAGSLPLGEDDFYYSLFYFEASAPASHDVNLLPKPNHALPELQQDDTYCELCHGLSQTCHVWPSWGLES